VHLQQKKREMKIWSYVEFNFFLWTNQMDIPNETRTY